MKLPERDELDRISSLWTNRLTGAFGISELEASRKSELYRYRITSIDRIDPNLIEVKVEFAPNAVYGLKHVPDSVASIVIPMFVHGEVNAPPGMPHLFTEFIVGGGIRPSNFMGENTDGSPRVYWDSSK